jgi:hypothetical protein
MGRKTKQVQNSLFFLVLELGWKQVQKAFSFPSPPSALFKARSLSTQDHTKLAYEARFHLRTLCFAIS